jgi:hypothetical protein
LQKEIEEKQQSFQILANLISYLTDQCNDFYLNNEQWRICAKEQFEIKKIEQQQQERFEIAFQKLMKITINGKIPSKSIFQHL